ncbi:MAG: UDP-N-acetylmuramoyl-tripeptide--D-alanyl-D-alanine ligase, partial [Crocinitomix sp.]|nr:UDP-N-acetylmuramoyl-tripeptide--D-alanyl-D-alanine ligase [Crocinitomix sp.]
LLTLQDLARFHRRQFNIPVIGITGSNGKTTTKELAGAVLNCKYNVLVTKGNLNNHLGVPFTLLELNASHEVAIIEMGANKPGDIKELAEIAEPTIGIITNIGAAHIEGFGSLAGVVKTKGEMYDFIAKSGGKIFVNAVDETLKGILPSSVEAITYNGENGIVYGQVTGQSPFIRFKWQSNDYQSDEIQSKLVGTYNFTNFLLALALGVYFDVDKDKMNEAIANYLPTNNRSQVTKTQRNTLIVDCYNANATSMKAALESFIQVEGPNKLAILGDMRELGPISNEEHSKIVRFLAENQLNAFLVGEEFSKIESTFPTYKDWKSFVDQFDLSFIDDSIVLLKGSRGIRLEEVIPYL